MIFDLVLTMHSYIPEQTVTLTKYYRNLLNMVNVKNNRVIHVCVLNIRIRCNLANIFIKRLLYLVSRMSPMIDLMAKYQKSNGLAPFIYSFHYYI